MPKWNCLFFRFKEIFSLDRNQDMRYLWYDFQNSNILLKIFIKIITSKLIIWALWFALWTITFAQWRAFQLFLNTFTTWAALFSSALNELSAHRRDFGDSHPHRFPVVALSLDPWELCRRRNILHCLFRWRPKACLVHCPSNMLQKCILKFCKKKAIVIAIENNRYR